jgi:FkbM family methyltransferase
MSLGSTINRLVGTALVTPTLGRLAARLFHDRIPHRGLVIDTSNPLIQPGTKAALLCRAYESAEYRFVQRYLLRDRDVLELGGSLGIISCTIRRALDPAFKLVVVEADPRLATILKRNLELNGCDRGVVIEQCAIAYGTDQVSFSPGASSYAGKLAEVGSEGNTIRVPAVTLSALVARHDIGHFCLVSDVEGVEWQFLREDPGALAGASRVILEAHDRAGYGSSDAFIEELVDSGMFRLIDRYGCVAVFDRVETAVQHA